MVGKSRGSGADCGPRSPLLHCQLCNLGHAPYSLCLYFFTCKNRDNAAAMAIKGASTITGTVSDILRAP